MRGSRWQVNAGSPMMNLPPMNCGYRYEEVASPGHLSRCIRARRIGVLACTLELAVYRRPKREQALVWMQSQAVFAESLRQHLHDRPSVHLIGEDHHESSSAGELPSQVGSPRRRGAQSSA